MSPMPLAPVNNPYWDSGSGEKGTSWWVPGLFTRSLSIPMWAAMRSELPSQVEVYLLLPVQTTSYELAATLKQGPTVCS